MFIPIDKTKLNRIITFQKFYGTYERFRMHVLFFIYILLYIRIKSIAILLGFLQILPEFGAEFGLVLTSSESSLAYLCSPKQRRCVVATDRDAHRIL